MLCLVVKLAVALGALLRDLLVAVAPIVAAYLLNKQKAETKSQPSDA